MPRAPLSARLTVAAVIVGLVGLTARPYVRHDLEAASFARELADKFEELDGIEVLDVDSGVTSTPSGGGYCRLTATLSLAAESGHAMTGLRLDGILKGEGDLYLWRALTPKGIDDGRYLYEFTAGTLGEGGSWDLRCG